MRFLFSSIRERVTDLARTEELRATTNELVPRCYGSEVGVEGKEGMETHNDNSTAQPQDQPYVSFQP